MRSPFTLLPPAPVGLINHILLADDDADDCFLFAEVVKEAGVRSKLTTVPHGQALMVWLMAGHPPPDVIFLDLNMPRKNGMQCLVEIKQSEHLKAIPVIILSTSFDVGTEKILTKAGALLCLRKPNEFGLLKTAICDALNLIVKDSCWQ